MQGKKKLKRSDEDYSTVLLHETKIKEKMTPSPVSVKVDTSFKEVPKIFEKYKIRHLPVVDDNNRLMGLISQRDLFRIQPPRKRGDGSLFYDDETLESIILPHVMVKDPFFMYEDDTMGDALIKIVEKKYGCILVVDREKVLRGILTQVDILKVAVQVYME